MPLACSPKLTRGNETISAEGSHQYDQLGSLEYCIAAQPMFMAATSRTKLGFVDDTNLGKISQVDNDVQHIIDSNKNCLNAHNAKSSPIII